MSGPVTVTAASVHRRLHGSRPPPAPPKASSAAERPCRSRMPSRTCARTDPLTEFRAPIEEARGGGGAWVQVPPSAIAELGAGSRIPVRATFDGVPYQGSVVSMGEDLMVIGILKDIRSRLGKSVGDEARGHSDSRRRSPCKSRCPRIWRRRWRRPASPVLSRSSPTPAARRSPPVSTGAKKPDTRQRRIDAAIEELKLEV